MSNSKIIYRIKSLVVCGYEDDNKARCDLKENPVSSSCDAYNTEWPEHMTYGSNQEVMDATGQDSSKAMELTSGMEQVAVGVVCTIIRIICISVDQTGLLSLF